MILCTQVSASRCSGDAPQTPVLKLTPEQIEALVSGSSSAALNQLDAEARLMGSEAQELEEERTPKGKKTGDHFPPSCICAAELTVFLSSAAQGELSFENRLPHQRSLLIEAEAAVGPNVQWPDAVVDG